MPNAPLQVRLEPWSEDDLGLLQRLNTPEMMVHLGGPETEEQVLKRLRDYVRHGFPVIVLSSGERVGSIGYWPIEWHGETVWETGWKVVPEFWGQGVATAALKVVVARATAERTHRGLHAFASVDNAASNAICRKAGFRLVRSCDMEFPEGRWSPHNDWQLDLSW